MKTSSTKIAAQIALGAALLMPAIAFAATNKKLSDVIIDVNIYLNQALVLLMALAIVLFVWYVIKYFIRTPDAKASERGQYILWSIIGFFVILSIWGIVNILSNTFGLGNAENQPNSLQSMSNIFPR